MSATGRGSERQADDFYETPAWCVHRLLEGWRPSRGGVWCEPAYGSGAIVKCMPHNDARRWVAVDVNDIEPSIYAYDAGAYVHKYTDYRQLQFGGRTPKPDVILSNPPYALAFDFARKAVTEAEHVVFLLRLNWLASAKRADWLRAHTPDVYVLPNRPSFVDRVECPKCGAHTTIAKQAVTPRCGACWLLLRRSAATDACEYAWLLWSPTATGRIHILPNTPKEERNG